MLPNFSVLIGDEEDFYERQGDGHLNISTGSQIGILPCFLNGIQRVREPMFIEIGQGPRSDGEYGPYSTS